jgi:anthraniloyl-CoA monooxygenase
VDKIQGSARPSLSWWEHFGWYHDTLEPWQFAFHFLTRSISGGKLARRDPAFVAATRAAWHAEHGRAPLETPFRSAGLDVPGRLLDVDGIRDRGLWLEAPGSEQELPAALASLHSGVLAGPAMVAIHGGSRLTRTLLAEEARLVARTPAMVVDDELTPDDAETLLLSGRADLVGRTSGRPDRNPVAGVSRSVGGGA